MITDPSQRKAKVHQAMKLFVELHGKTQRAGQLVLKMAAHPDCTERQLLDAVHSYRTALTNTRTIKTSLLMVMNKEGLSNTMAYHSIDSRKVYP